MMDRSDSLEQLDPSPVDETPSAYKEGYFPPQRSTSSLGLGNHGPTFWLTRIQRYSSYAFTVFTAVHLTTTSLIPLVTQDIDASSTYLARLRPSYQTAFTEPLFVIYPLFAHVASGLLLRWHRRRAMLRKAGAEVRSEKKTIPWPKVSGTSMLGFASLPLVLSHATLNRALPYIVRGNNEDIGLDYVGHGVSKHPFLGWLGFTALIGVVGAHIVWGSAKWLGLTPAQAGASGPDAVLKRKRRWWTINGIAAALFIAWSAGGMGLVVRNGAVGGWVGREYDALYQKLPLVGRWL